MRFFKIGAVLMVAGSLSTAAYGQISASVTVNAASTTATVPSTAYGIHTSVYDSNFADAAVPGKLNAIGMSMIRWPGGGYADVYHWSNKTDTQFQNSGNLGFVASNTDIGHLASLVGSVTGGQAIITVNYGSSLQGNSGGEPKDAAAEVAWCNGATTSTVSIGLDSKGNDWKTVGYWASLRAASPLATDDGKNFLRIGHSASLGVKYWEIGNEVFGNGYIASFTGESDWHYPYDGSTRTGQSALSPTSYGTNVNAFVTAMKAVDSTIKIGAVLGTEGYDSWASSWDGPTLAACGTSIDFVVWHDYMGFYLAPAFTSKDPADVLARSGTVKTQVSDNQALITQYCGTNAPNVKQFVTETNGNPLTNAWVNNLFAADTFAGLIENGVANVDWLELHSTFLDSSDNPQGPYYAIQLVHNLEAAGELAVASTTTNTLVTPHASKKADGSVGLMLINKDPSNNATVSVSVSGVTLGSTGTQYNFPQNASTFTTSSISGVGNTFSVSVPAYSIVEVVIPQGTSTPNYTLGASPSSVSVTRGSTAPSTVTVTPSGGFTGSVALSASGLPSGVTASFSPASTTGTSTLTFTASSTATTGTSTVTVKGTSGTLSHTSTVALTVNAVATPNYTLSASPGSVSVTQGSMATSTVTVTPSGGFTGSVALSASGLPSGVTAAFSPASTTSTSTLTFTANSTAVTGTSTVTVTGTSGTLSHTSTVALTVNASSSGSGPATITAKAGANGAWFDEDDVLLSTTSAITALSITITVPSSGVTYNAMYNTLGTSITQSHTSGTNIVYAWRLTSGSIGAGSSYTFGAQLSGNGTTHNFTGDTYSVTYTSGGKSYTQTGVI